MTHDRRPVSDTQVERALGHRAAIGSDDGLLSAIVLQARVTRQDRTWWMPFGVSGVARPVALAWVALALVAALAVGSLIAGSFKPDHSDLSVVLPIPSSSSPADAPPRTAPSSSAPILGPNPTAAAEDSPSPTPSVTPAPLDCHTVLSGEATAASAPAAARFPGLGRGSVAYLTHGTSRSDLWIADRPGSPSRHIAEIRGDSVVRLEGWSARGSSLLLLVGEDSSDDCTGLYAVNGDGSSATQLTLDGLVGDAALSPDGQRVAYLRGAPGLHLRIVDLTGTRSRPRKRRARAFPSLESGHRYGLVT